MSARSILVWTLAAVLGLSIAAGVTIVASKLSSQRIGLASEPLSAGEDLAPPGGKPPAGTLPSRTTGTAPAGSEERGEAPDGDD